jgi:hypothetical protein
MFGKKHPDSAFGGLCPSSSAAVFNDQRNDLDACFQTLFLESLPVLFMLLCGVVRVLQVLQLPVYPQRDAPAVRSKLQLACVLLLALLPSLRLVLQRDHTADFEIVVLLGHSVAWLLSLALTAVELRRCVAANWVTFGFWYLDGVVSAKVAESTVLALLDGGGDDWDAVLLTLLFLVKLGVLLVLIGWVLREKEGCCCSQGRGRGGLLDSSINGSASSTGLFEGLIRSSVRPLKSFGVLYAELKHDEEGGAQEPYYRRQDQEGERDSYLKLAEVSDLRYSYRENSSAQGNSDMRPPQSLDFPSSLMMPAPASLPAPASFKRKSDILSYFGENTAIGLSTKIRGRGNSSSPAPEPWTRYVHVEVSGHSVTEVKNFKQVAYDLAVRIKKNDLDVKYSLSRQWKEIRTLHDALQALSEGRYSVV